MARNLASAPRLRRGLVGMLLALAIIASGCGSDDDAGDTTTSETSATTAPTTAATTETTAATTSETTERSTTSTEPVGESAEVFFSVGDGSDCSEVAGFARQLPAGADPVPASFEALVAGPNPDETEAGSFFSVETADVIRSVTLVDGLLVVDFADLRSLMPNASTSCGSEALLAQLNTTAFQFAEVERTRYLIEGSCDVFANWLQRECFETDRDGTEVVGDELAEAIAEQADGSGCTPASADGLPDGRWFGFVDDAGSDDVAFDLACWFSGDAAVIAAAEDGEESPPPNDYHIRNDNNRLRTLAVAPSADVSWLPIPGDPNSTEVVGYATWLAEKSGREFDPGVWLEIDDGRIVSIEEQYVP